MSRSGAGTYSLPNVAVVTGTTITAGDENTTRSDIATEITDSLSRSGKGAMLAALLNVNGTVGSPSVSFTNDTGSGLYRIGSNDIGFAINGVKVQEWTATTALIVQPLTASGTLTVTGATILSSTLALASDLAINTNKFTVTAASGNTVVAGTLGVTGAATLSSTLGVTGAATLTGGFVVGAGVTVDAGSNKIINVTDPTTAQQAATKNYVDTSTITLNKGARVWGTLQCGAAGAVTVIKAVNITSASYSTNNLTIVFTSNMADVNFAVIAMPYLSANVNQKLTSDSANKLVGSCRVNSLNSTTGAGLNFANGDGVEVVIFD